MTDFVTAERPTPATCGSWTRWSTTGRPSCSHRTARVTRRRTTRRREATSGCSTTCSRKSSAASSPPRRRSSPCSPRRSAGTLPSDGRRCTSPAIAVGCVLPGQRVVGQRLMKVIVNGQSTRRSCSTCCRAALTRASRTSTASRASTWPSTRTCRGCRICWLALRLLPR